jgi:hypothetical protein
VKRFRVTFEADSEKEWYSLNPGGRRALHWPGAIEIFPKYIVPADAVIEVIGREVFDGYYRAGASAGGSAYYLYHRRAGIWSWLVYGGWSTVTDEEDLWFLGRDWPIDDDAVRGGALVPIA